MNGELNEFDIKCINNFACAAQQFKTATMIGIAVANHISHINSGNNMVMIFCIDISDKLVNFGGYTSNTSWKRSIFASCTNMQMIQSKRGFWLFPLVLCYSK